MITRYAGGFAAKLSGINSGSAAPTARLAGYAVLYLQVLRQQKMCLSGMLSAEYATLSRPMREAVTSFFDTNERWLERVLEEGRRDGTLHFSGPAPDTARVVVACLEGAMLVARPYGDAARSRPWQQGCSRAHHRIRRPARRS